MSTRLASRLLALAVIATASPASADVDALGQFTQSFDLSVPAFHELAPAMSLRYRSGGGDGLVGAGWSLAAGSQIQRLSRTHGVARMDASDVYVLDGEELIPCAANSASPSCTSAVASSGSSSGFYSTRVESFRRVQFLFNAFVVWDPDGTHSIYMSYDGGYTYLLARQLDVHANMVDYHYACTTTCVLDSITYPGTTIQLYREGRPDPVVLPNRQWLAQRLHSIAIVENGSLLRAYRLGYAQSLANGQSLLSSVQQVGNDAAIDASGNVTGGTAMPPVTFTSPSLLSAGSGPTVTAISTPDLSQIPATNVTALSPRFASEQVTYTVGEHWNALAGDFVPNPYGVVVGDFDGDGRADWLSWVTQNNSCTGLETETILESKSAHQAMVKWDFVPNGLAVFDCATHVWVADMDGDHRDDLLVSGQGHLSVLYSQGDGTFLLSSVGPTAGDVKRCAVGDFDGDGRDDLACTTPNGTTDQVVVARSPSLNVWKTSVDQTLGLGTTNLVAAGDVNADGLSDLVIANLVNGQWVLWTGLSRGDGTFAWTSQATAWRYNANDTDELMLADLDGDAKADVIFNCKIQFAGDELFVGLAAKGNTSGRFLLQAGFMPSWLENAELGDYDGDGKIDLYLASSYRWAHGRGDGTFDAPVANPQSSTCMPFIADLNGDRRSDVLCVGDDNNGTFTLTDAPSPIVRGDLQHWNSADVTGDGVPDLVYVRYANPGYEISVIPSGATSATVQYVAPSTTQPLLDEADASRFMLVDVGGPNGVPDGRADLVLISTNGSTLDVDTYLSNGNGTFTPRHDYPWRPSGTLVAYTPVDLQNWRPADLDGNGTTDFIHFTTNGYGLHVDYLLSRGDGTFGSGQQDYFANAFPSHSADMLPADVNGDGLTDFVFAQPGYDSSGNVTSTGTIYTLVNNGDGTFLPLAAGGQWITPDVRNLRVADLDGDGLSDLVHVTTTVDNAALSSLNLDEYAGDGKGNWTYRFERVQNQANNPREYNLLEDTELLHFTDVDGDGRADILAVSSYYDGGMKLAVVVATAASGWQVTATEGPAIASTYDFRPWRWQPAPDLASGGLALASITPLSSPEILLARPSDRMSHVDNGVGGTTDVEYTTLVGGRSYLPQGALPRVVSAVTAGDHAAPQPSSERITYAFGSASYSNVLRRPLGFGYRRVTDHNSQRIAIHKLDDQCGAMPYEDVVQDLAGNTLAIDVYATIGEGAAAPYTCMTYDHARYTCASGACALRIDTTLTFDIYGNTTATTETATGTFNKLVQTPTAAPNLSQYIVDRPASKQTYQYENSAWNLKASQAFAYDGSPGVGVVGAKGELSEVRTWDGQNTLLTDYQYWPSGFVHVEQTPTGTTTTTYDAIYGLYPATVSVGPLPWGSLTTTHGYDLNTGLEDWISDANGAMTKTTFDPLGRAIRVDRPDGSYATTAYSVVNGHRVERHAIADGSADGIWNESWLDGLGRTFHTVRKDGASQDTVFTDATSLPASVSNVYVTGNVPVGSVSYSYDALGRVLVRRDTDGSTTTSTYGTSTVTSYDQNAKPSMATFDGRGAVNRVDEYNQGTSAATIYMHDVFGHLTRITDSAGNVTSYTYDPLGRVSSTTNPDRGTLQTFFKTNGLVDYMLDAMGNRISFIYDGIGRTIERDEIGPSTGLRVVKLYYDTDSSGAFVANGLGRLVQATDTQPTASLSEAYAYDIMGRATSTQRCVGATCMTVQQAFDSAGRLATLTYPDAEVVTYGYDVMGRQASLSGYATATYNEVDQLKTLAYANTETTMNAYDPARHWLNSVNVTLPAIRLGFGFYIPRQYTATYTHDVAARISSLGLNYLNTSVSLAYTYDDLGRLTAVTSDAAHTESFTYDALGRMKSSSYTGALYYADPRHVHAPTHADAGGTGDDRSYDPDGNVRMIADHSGRNLNLAWTPSGQLASVHDNVSGTQTAFVYDRNGERVAKLGTVPDFYFGGLVELRNGVLTKYYTLAGKLVAKNDGSVSYYVQDHRGSTRIVANAAHNVVDTYDYSAFGRPIAKSESTPNDVELAGGRFDDESALVYMNARYYDAEMAHFISADTLIPNVNDPQSLHRYSYTQQDPINFNDPSGHLRMQVEWKKDLDAQALRIDSSMNKCDSWDSDASLGCAYIADALAHQYNPTAAEDDMDMLIVASESHAQYYKKIRAYQEWAWKVGMMKLDAANAKNNPPKQAEQAVLITRVAGESITNSKTNAAAAQGGLLESEHELRRSYEGLKYLTGQIHELYEEIMAIPHDEYAFIGIEKEEEPIPFLKLHIGETHEVMEVIGHSNTHGLYTESLGAHGPSIDGTVGPDKAYVGVFLAQTVSDHPALESKTEILVEGAIGDAYAGAFSTGDNWLSDNGVYIGLKFGNGFVGIGGTFESFAWQTRAAIATYNRVLAVCDHFWGAKY